MPDNKNMFRQQKLSMVILAGGASSRMGKDKSDLPICGKTFLEIQIEKGQLLGIKDILVSGYRGKKCSVRVVEDRIPGRGPLGGLESCLREAENEWCLVLGVDVPMVPADVLERLIEKAFNSSAPAVILRHGEHEEPLIGVYRTDLADAMAQEITERKGSVFAFLRRIGYGTYVSGAADKYFANVNDPAAYDTLIRNACVR
ncbi:MAG: molybdenum cofactor guanylyltransferase [Eubacteriales bacterium]|nr:molybdenum cofactor guanylyltransferase [Eubacteriales bacterium]